MHYPTIASLDHRILDEPRGDQSQVASLSERETPPKNRQERGLRLSLSRGSVRRLPCTATRVAAHTARYRKIIQPIEARFPDFWNDPAKFFTPPERRSNQENSRCDVTGGMHRSPACSSTPGFCLRMNAAGDPKGRCRALRKMPGIGINRGRVSARCRRVDAPGRLLSPATRLRQHRCRDTRHQDVSHRW